MACGVLGCLGICVLAAVGFVAFAAVMLVGHLGNEIADRASDPPQPVKPTSTARPGPIQPTKLTASTTITLPGPVTAVGRGGNGRFLLLRIHHQIHVFDPNEGILLAPFQFDGTDLNTVFAASATKLFVYRQGVLERYNLMVREPTERSTPLAESPTALAIGAGSDGPLFTFTTRQFNATTTIAEFNADTLLPQGGTKPLNRLRIGRAGPRISSDGSTIGVGPDDGNKGQFIFSGTRGLESRQLAGGNSPGHISPSPDGQWLYTPRGVFKPDGKQFLKPENTYFYTLPAAHGNDFFLSLEVGANGTIRESVMLHPTGAADTESFVNLDGVKGPAGLSADDPASDKIAADQRVHFWPAAGLIAVIPPSDKTIQLYKVNVAELLPTIQERFLVIGSDPPTVAERGEQWRYPMITWSSSKVVKYKVLTGPIGMKPNPDGSAQLMWSVPVDFEDEEQFVIVEASDGSLTTQQKFRLVILDRHNP